MKAFLNLNIFNRLVLALILSIGVFVTFGIFTITEMNELSAVTEDLYNDPLKVSNAATEIRVNIIKIQREMRELILHENEHDINQSKIEVDILNNDVLDKLDFISEHTVAQETKEKAEEVRRDFLRWRGNHDEVIRLSLLDRDQEATDMTQGINTDFVDSMLKKLVAVENMSQERARGLIENVYEIEQGLKSTVTILVLILSFLLSIFFIFIIRSILGPINTLVEAMNKSIESNNLQKVHLDGKDEMASIAKYYNMLVDKLNTQFWIKDVQNKLNEVVSGDQLLNVIIEKGLNCIARTMGAGKGAFYLYNRELNLLQLKGSYAFTEREILSSEYELGEGVVGQVAIERKPILLRNINPMKERIVTGVYQGEPMNTYTFPLVKEGALYGVMELASFEEFDAPKLEFLNQAARIITTNLYSSLQNQEIMDLLVVSEEAQREVEVTAHELQKANAVLEEQQEQLQKQTAELQQTNAELEEQQELLQRQTAELQQSNAELEEHQQILEQQSGLLNMKNVELEKSKEELVKYSQQLEMGNRYKSEFLANMSHELRTPLNSIILLSRLLMNNKNHLVNEDLEKVEVINNSGKELLRLINDILDLSKIEAGKVDINNVEFHSNELVKELRLLFEKIAEEKKIQFKVTDSLNTFIVADRHKISQILRNLISNAIKFTEKGTVNLSIYHSPEKKNSVKFSVTDTGIGISQENLASIFEEFQQGDGSICRCFEGTGLGLSISKKLAELIQGYITVESTPYKGSDFTLHLDNAINQHAEEADGYTSGLMESAATVDGVQIPEGDKVILIIEDDPHFAAYIKEISEGVGFKTLVAKDGREGINLLHNHQVDGILLDLILPDVNGIDILREIKEIPEFMGIPVHIISSCNKNNIPQKLGAIGYQEKPVDKVELLEIIGKLMSFKEKYPKKVLLMIDNVLKRKLVETLLKDQKVMITGVETVQNAKKMLDKENYDVIILDLELEDDKGIRICHYLEQKELEVPVIIYTGKELTIEQEKKIREYADSIIVKTANSDKRLIDEVTLFLHNIKKRVLKSQYLMSKTNIEHSLRIQEKRILIVDDDSRNIFVLATALEEYGADILEAENGEVALSLLQENKVDLVLMDIMMPVMNGLETIKAMRKDEDLKDIPIIAITAKTLKEDKAKCILAGANDYISKPVDYDVLIRLVKAWIDKRS
ncbi:response regulator [Alkaliphilus hydrothermalis]|uniref:Stage 0 sporulation protein A homolog n=1 Tax=Alkaliphilus hydrothermalis TaxID=1482730 RepID=A0ABS2NQ44_9FIRM|nr:signal transduction histidine kinase/DNA-binding response OmpR family regulator [Alkaliphilus hydrothermalis]